MADFDGMTAASPLARQMARVATFVQREPDDGHPATERTEAYLGYDSGNLDVVFLAFDRQPELIRARLEPREAIGLDEDEVGFYLDTFHDRRRAYQFACNPLGVQYDSWYSDDTGQDDSSFDALWTSEARPTARGYMVRISVPFKSLRFPPRDGQIWGLTLWRWLPRRNEGSWWPRQTRTIRGILVQAATMTGPRGITGGRNENFIPYGSFRAFRAPDTRQGAPTPYVSRRAELNGGLDAKLVVNNGLVLDLTANPDFAQVETDDPQPIVNQRFEVYFPEKRPFFTENGGYFDVPLVDTSQHVLFTRRIGDPSIGARLTGKIGAYAIGALVSDDRSAGASLPVGNPLDGTRAVVDVARMTRDVGQASRVGVIYTDRTFHGAVNRVVGSDAVVALSKTWVATLFGARSWTRELTGSASSGHDVEIGLVRTSRTFSYRLGLLGRSPGFLTESGYMPRSDQQMISQSTSYTLRPSGGAFRDITFGLDANAAWDGTGQQLFWHANPSVTFDLRQQASVMVGAAKWRDTLRPIDYPALTAVRGYDERAWQWSFVTRQLRRITATASFEQGRAINFVPPAGTPPAAITYTRAQALVRLHASDTLAVTGSYLLDSGGSIVAAANAYTNNVFRLRWDWQMTREASLRLIAQNNRLATSPLYRADRSRRNLNLDVLFTYLAHPGTALYVGYTTDFGNPWLSPTGALLPRLGNDGRQLFVKMSYLIRR